MFPLKAIIFLLFRPARFHTLSADYGKPHPQASDWSSPETPTHRVRTKIAASFLAMFSAIAAGWVTGFLCSNAYGPAPPPLIQLLQYFGIGILLWATLAKGGWNIQTIKGGSLPELVDQWIYRGLYCLGSYLLVLSVSWPAARGSP